MDLRLPASLVLALAAARAPAQIDWQVVGESTWRGHVRMVFDSVRGVLVQFGGVGGTVNSNTVHGDLLESGDGPWRVVVPAGPAPTPRWSHAIAYDAARGRTVVYGGIEGVTRQVLGETWSWDGASWRAEAAGPPPRHACAMTFDPIRQRVVLFGGFLNGVASDETWEWDGAGWSQMQPPTSPPARWGHQMVFDPVRGRVVVGGGGTSLASFDLWEWDGATWSPVRTGALAPTARANFGMAFDVARARLVVHGSGNPQSVAHETWEFDGAAWTRPQPRNTAAAANHALVWDAVRQRVVAYGSNNALVHEWDGQDWRIDERRSEPEPASRARMLWDPVGQRTLMIGLRPTAENHLWSFADGRWALADVGFATTGVAPPQTVDAGWAFDTRRGVAMLFGGLTSGVVNSLWEFDGARWTAVAVTRPPVRADHVFVYDEARGRAVVFGGEFVTAGQFLDDTWEWDGTRWHGYSPRHVPAPRAGAAAVFDPIRQRVVMFGGRTVWGVTLADTWEWDGSDWVWRQPASWPTPRSGAAMAWDAARERAVLVGGDTYEPDVWEWDGSDWAPRAVAHPLGFRKRLAFAYNPVRAEFVAFGGDESTYGPQSGETRLLGPLDPARFESFADGCGPGAPRLAASALPWLGSTVEVGADGFGSGAGVVYWLGFARQSVPLGPIGMPGCRLLVSPDVVVAAPRATVPIPNDRALLGARFHVQAYGPAPGANPLGVLATDGATATVGAR